MDPNPRNQEYDKDKNMYGMKKIMYLQKYGVKSFPYRGRRKFTPSISKSLDGGIVISNDVFGLTIRQFERVYKVCLDRRKTHEQWILNLRYPDKCSNEYLEYLQDCVYYNEDILPWPGNAQRDNYCYKRLVCTIGSEINIRTRQRLLIVIDIIQNLIETKTTQISSGSLAEGMDLPGSDVDKMICLDNVDVIQNVRNIKHQIQHTTLVMEPDKDYPGFTRLRLIVESEEDTYIILSECCERTSNGEYVSVERFLHNIRQLIPANQISSHGPCFSDTDQNFDMAICLQSKSLPYIAIQWVTRRRHQWPPNVVIDKIVNNGCLLVPIGPRTTSENNLLWRLSFSVAEKQLVHSFNFTQLLCYGLLKLTLKRIINTNDGVKDLLCSYFLKTALFWVSEEVEFEIFKLHKLFYCFFLCLDKLVFWINNCFCPNYFIPKHNMFLGKVDQSNNKKLLSVLNSIKCGGMDGLMNNVFPAESVNHSLSSTNREKSFIILDFFFYKACEVPIPSRNMHSCYKSLQYVKSLKMFASPKFITDTCDYYYGLISQYTAQMLPPPNTKSKGNTIHKLYHRHLKDGIRTDAVSGWLLYASYYYVTGQYNVTLKLTEYVLSRCTHDMVQLNRDFYKEEDINSYRQNVHSKLTFIDRMKLATVNNTRYMRYSSLIPEELKLEVEDGDIDIPPVVMSFCLRFLCHQHLGDIFNRKKALNDLLLAVENDCFVSSDELSDSKTILGVCYEISGDITNAYQYFDEALEVDEFVCRSAKARKSTLLFALT
ncbi:Hypothetical predicted protein [Mytilus galloprovincialis]|uniref:Mab-21-like HhH/H2TH-like domain-containing protein n=1 Tax=Mytilus galloprovincialis TaxID=29158 RepID=A0A8B6DPL6_MYTGA|nr:Hypothetical predicted protein [Mytilus galloprovincialis]